MVFICWDGVCLLKLKWGLSRSEAAIQLAKYTSLPTAGRGRQRCLLASSCSLCFGEGRVFEKKIGFKCPVRSEKCTPRDTLCGKLFWEDWRVKKFTVHGNVWPADLARSCLCWFHTPMSLRTCAKCGGWGWGGGERGKSHMGQFSPNLKRNCQMVLFFPRCQAQSSTCNLLLMSRSVTAHGPYFYGA